MRRNFCVLPPACSEEMVLDCARHRHLNLREVKAAEAAGEIQRLDVDPLTRRERYIEKKFNWSPSAIPACLMHAAAGVIFCDASSAQERAKEHVEIYGQVEHEERPHMEGPPWVELAGVTFDADDVWFGDPQPGRPVQLVLNPREPDPEKWVVLNGMDFNRTSDASEIPRRPSVRALFHLRAPDAYGPAADFYKKRWPSEPNKYPFSELKQVRREFRVSLDRMNAAWPHILQGFQAGRWSRILTKMPAGKLPSPLLQKALQAYLHSA